MAGANLGMADANQTQFEQNRLKVRVVTPERILIDMDAASVTLPGEAGVLEALPGAAPLLTATSGWWWRVALPRCCRTG